MSIGPCIGGAEPFLFAALDTHGFLFFLFPYCTLKVYLWRSWIERGRTGWP